MGSAQLNIILILNTNIQGSSSNQHQYKVQILEWKCTSIQSTK